MRASIAQQFMPQTLRLALQSALRVIEAIFDRCFGARTNPWRHLGALGFLFF